LESKSRGTNRLSTQIDQIVKAARKSKREFLSIIALHLHRYRFDEVLGFSTIASLRRGTGCTFCLKSIEVTFEEEFGLLT
jgi:hypothetical protein